MVTRPTEKRLIRASAEMNILRENHRHVVEAHDMDHRNAKKFVPDLSITIDIIVKLFQDCFGKSEADVRKKSSFSKLAQAEMQDRDIGWQRMLKARKNLKEYVANVIKNKELWAVPESFEDEDAEGALLDDDGTDDGSDDNDSDGSSDDWDVPLGELKKRQQKTKLKFWMESMKPLVHESEDDYAKRVMFLLGRGSADQSQLRRVSRGRGDATVKPPSVDDIVQAGVEAREFYLKLRPDRREPVPTKVLRHHDIDGRGRQYELQWKYPGCGPGKKKWVGPDTMAKYPALLVDYNKVPCLFLCLFLFVFLFVVLFVVLFLILFLSLPLPCL